MVPTEPEALEAAGPVVHPDSPALRVDQDLVRVAFGRLSEFDQQVLWRTAVEGVSPAVIGTMMGMSANRVSVAAFGLGMLCAPTTSMPTRTGPSSAPRAMSADGCSREWDGMFGASYAPDSAPESMNTSKDADTRTCW